MERPFKLDDLLSLGRVFSRLESTGVEFDQRMAQAFASAERAPNGAYTDSRLLTALLRLNPSLLRGIDLPFDFVDKTTIAGNDAIARDDLCRILNESFIDRRERNTLSAGDFLVALSDRALRTGDAFVTRPVSVDRVIEALYGDPTRPLSHSPTALALLKRLSDTAYEPDDFQYVLAISENRARFVLASVLGDFEHILSDNVTAQRRVILTHLQNRLGVFTADEIEELENLINSVNARENDFQRFFDKHPHFFRKWDYREVHSQVVLARREGSLIPDFILTDRELHRAAVLDLKLPRPRIIRRHQNRDRLASSVMEARAQLLKYRDWFRERLNRLALRQKVGMEIYEPDLIVVVGRSSEFISELDRQSLASDHRDIELVVMCQEVVP